MNIIILFFYAFVKSKSNIINKGQKQNKSYVDVYKETLNANLHDYKRFKYKKYNHTRKNNHTRS